MTAAMKKDTADRDQHGTRGEVRKLLIDTSLELRRRALADPSDELLTRAAHIFEAVELAISRGDPMPLGEPRRWATKYEATRTDDERFARPWLDLGEAKHHLLERADWFLERLQKSSIAPLPSDGRSRWDFESVASAMVKEVSRVRPMFMLDDEKLSTAIERVATALRRAQERGKPMDARALVSETLRACGVDSKVVDNLFRH